MREQFGPDAVRVVALRGLHRVVRRLLSAQRVGAGAEKCCRAVNNVNVVQGGLLSVTEPFLLQFFSKVVN